MVTTMTFVFHIKCNALIRAINVGVTGLQVEELWSLDSEEFKNLGSVRKFCEFA